MAQLRDSMLKISRAKHHLQALNDSISAIVKANIHAIRVEFDPKQSKHIVYAKRTQPIPIEWSLMIGDFAHNVRSALDVAVYSLSTLAPDDSARIGLQFPIFECAKTYAGKRERYLRGVPDGKRTIIDELQPCATGMGDKDFLVALANINNTDKHRLIHIIEIPASLTGMSVVGPGTFGSNIVIGKGAALMVGRGAAISTNDFAIKTYPGVVITEAETAIGEFQTLTKTNVNMKIDLAGEIQFGTGGSGVKQRNVIHVLNCIIQYAEKIIGLLAA